MSLISDLLQTEDPLLTAANQRAARWKGLCQNLCAGLPSVFSSYELEIDGKRTPTIDTSSVYRCCVEYLEALQGELVAVSCPLCQTAIRLENNVWRAAL